MKFVEGRRGTEHFTFGKDGGENYFVFRYEAEDIRFMGRVIVE